MTTKTKSPKVAARTPGTSGTPGTKKTPTAAPVNERLRREAQAAVAANIASLDAAQVGHNEQGGEPQKPDQPKPNQQQRQEPKKDASPRPGKKAVRPPAKHAPKAAKPAKAQGGAKAPKVKRLSCLDAAAQIIGKDPIGCKDLIAEMQSRKLWSSPNGKTPDASLYAAIIREIAARKGGARFKKVDRGLFVANPGSTGR